jgi:NAD(P)-dependent dehydrogenase (short-subunit alcohol dehydrogenase family)
MLSQLAVRMHLAYQSEVDPERRTSIINIASIAGHRSTSLASVYSTSKHALMGMTKNIAAEYAGQGIRCNSVSPVSRLPRSWLFNCETD